MITLALDLGTKTGWALCQGTVTSGLWDLSNKRHEGGGMRYLKFRRHLEALPPPGVVYYELVRRHIGTDAAHVYGGLLATLSTWCEERGIPYQGVGVGTIKKHATGQGNASKQAMIEAMRDKGFNPGCDNEADALAILLYGKDME
jgi:crossover junction endodeoxyribonuclease RuvC